MLKSALFLYGFPHMVLGFFFEGSNYRTVALRSTPNLYLQSINSILSIIPLAELKIFQLCHLYLYAAVEPQCSHCTFRYKENQDYF